MPADNQRGYNDKYFVEDGQARNGRCTEQASLRQHLDNVASRACQPSPARARTTPIAHNPDAPFCDKPADLIPLPERRIYNSYQGYTGLSHPNGSQSEFSKLPSRCNPYPYIVPQRISLMDTRPPPSSTLTMVGNPSGSAVDISKHSSEGSSYGSAEGASPWSKEQQAKRRKKWLIVGLALTLIGLTIAGAVTGVLLTRNNAVPSSSTSSGANVVKQSNPKDPSTFIKNPNLHQAFYGIAYTPENSQLPNCGNALGDVITDIQLLSQLTRRIRLYGADCNQTALVLEAIRQTKVDMQVWLGNYPIATDNGAAYERQRDIIRDALSTYGTDHISGITVGNEFMLNYLLGQGATTTDPNSPVAERGADILIANIQDTRTMLDSMHLPKTLAVGTSDAGSYFNNRVLEAVDYGMANVHPWFANVSIESSAQWTNSFFQAVDVAQADALANRPQMYIAETGWPSKSSDAGNASNGPSTASVANLQEFLDTFVCQANTNGTAYFYFELFDEPWKDRQFGGVEGWWGLFNSDRTLKDIRIPNCQAP